MLRLLPEIILSLSGIVLMLVEPFLTRARRTILVSLAAMGSGLALVATIYPALHPGEAFSGLLRIDGFSVFVHVVVEAVAFLVIIGSVSFTRRTEASARNILTLMQRPQAYNARAGLASAPAAIPGGVR